MQRSVVGAPQMSAEARAYYEQLFRKLFESQEWQQYRAKNSLFGEFTTGTALMGSGCASARSMRAEDGDRPDAAELTASWATSAASVALRAECRQALDDLLGRGGLARERGPRRADRDFGVLGVAAVEQDRDVAFDSAASAPACPPSRASRRARRHRARRSRRGPPPWPGWRPGLSPPRPPFTERSLEVESQQEFVLDNEDPSPLQ